MSVPLEPRLDEFERRLRALEAELAELRALSADGHAPATAPPEPEPEREPEPEPVGWAEELIARGDYRALVRRLERERRSALGNDELEALLDLHRAVRLAEEQAPTGVEAELGGLGYTIRQNARYVARRLGVEVDEQAFGRAAEPEPESPPTLELDHELKELREPAQTWEAAHVAAEEQRVPSAPLFELPDFSKIDLFGAKALAVAGGIVTLLGIVFFFVLAVHRGWVGPEGRIGLGAFAAALVYGAGLELRRRYGESYSSLAAVAAGIAGGYGVLLAAAQLYHFVGHTVALVIAVAIAGIGLATALRWRSQMIAALGLLGATLAPLAVAAQDGLSVLGTSFVAFMAIATAAVAIRERWDPLLVLGALASLPQALALALQARYAGESPGSVVALAAIFSATAVGTGVARQLRAGRRDLQGLPTSFLWAGAAFAVGCALRLYGSPESRGFALLAIAIAVGVFAAALFPRRRERDLSALAGALALVVGGIAFGELMSGSPLAFAWSGEAAVLAWLARRVREIRYQLFALVYLAAAVIHVLAVDVTLRHLFKPLDTPAAGALAVVAVGVAAALVAWQTAPRRTGFSDRRGFFGPLVPLYRGLAASQREIRVAGVCLAALAAVYAVSLGVLAASPSFDWGHVAMYSLWSAIGAGVYVFGLRRPFHQLRYVGLGWLALTAVAAIANGLDQLSFDARAAACLIAGLSLLCAGLVELFGVVEPGFEELGEDERVLGLGVAGTAGVLGVASLSVGAVAAISSYDWGRVAMFSLWSAIALGVLVTALRRRAVNARIGALAAFGVTVVVSFAVGEKLLSTHGRGAAFLVVGAALIAAAILDQRLSQRRELSPVAVALVLAETGIGIAAFVALLGGTVGSVDERGLAFLGLAGLQLAACRVAGQRDFRTLLWGTGLVLAYGASERLLPGTYHVLSIALAAGALAWLSSQLREPALLAAAGASAVVGVATAVIRLAPPAHLFVAHRHPGEGALGVLIMALAAAAVAGLTGEGSELLRRGRSLGFWVTGVLSVYGLSLLILAVFQASFSSSVDTNFHRGHTVVSAFWGLIGLGLLYFGLTRLRALRVAGFAMFTVSLAKIFLFDLPSLSSITRALSFLAVGAVLLAGGFFYQRLASSQPPQPKRQREPVEWPGGLRRPELWAAALAGVILVVWFGSGLAPLG